MARKRKKGKRDPNGRLSQRKSEVAVRIGESERDVKSVAIEARQRIWGVSIELATSPHGGTVLGRLLGEKSISREQFVAAEYYLADRNAYHRGILAPLDAKEPRAEGLSAPTKTYEEFVADAKDRWAKVQAIVDEACREDKSGLPRTALDLIVVRDIAAPHAVGSLRTALNHLVRHYLVGKRRAA